MSFYTPNDEVIQEESEEEYESEMSDEDETVSDEEILFQLQKMRPKWCPATLPQQIPSEEDCLPGPEVLSSSSDEDPKPKPRKPPKKFFENHKFYTRYNKLVLPKRLWDEEENLDNIETLMKQTEDVKELDAAPMEGVTSHIKPNLGYDDVVLGEALGKPASSGDSNFDLILSSSDEEKIPKMGRDHYKQLLLADDHLIDCQLGRKTCRAMPPTKYYGLSKIIERKERYKSLRGNKSTLGSNINPAVSSYEGSSFSPSGSLKKKQFKLKEPFPKRDSIDKTLSSMSSIEGSSESDRNEPRVDPSKLFSKCKWYEDCIFKVLFKLAVRREKKLATIKTDLDFDVDEILDNLYVMSRDPRNYLYLKVIEDFTKYKEDFFKKSEFDGTNKTEDPEEIKLWTNIQIEEKISIHESDLCPVETKKKWLPADVSGRLYRKIPRKDTPRARIEARLAAERALDVKKKKNIIQKKFKPIEINMETISEAMNVYYKEKEQKRRKDREPKAKDDDLTTKKKVDKKEEKLRMSATSLHPSFTKLIPPYSNVCKERIHKTLKKYRKMFDEELRSLAEQQTFALSGVALRRMYLITIAKGKDPVQFTEAEEARLKRLFEGRS